MKKYVVSSIGFLFSLPVLVFGHEGKVVSSHSIINTLIHPFTGIDHLMVIVLGAALWFSKKPAVRFFGTAAALAGVVLFFV